MFRFDSEYYNKDYFVTPEGKKYHTAEGEEKGWSYNNETGEFYGAGPISQAWKKLFHPRNMLDVGAGRGTFIAYARDIGIEAVGFDFSPWATSDEGRYARCEPEWLIQHDAVEVWPYENDYVELLVALDFYEHIYEVDLPKVIPEMYRVSSKFIFLQIATAADTVGGVKGEGYVLKKGETVPGGLEGCAVAGHVTVMSESWWRERFEEYDPNGEWMVRPDLVEGFIASVDNRIIANWLQNSILVYERLS